MAIYLRDDDKCVLLALSDEGECVGLLEAALRYDYVEGCSTQPVCYLEGLFVSPQFRGKQIARKLVQACERWGRERGCVEMASDAELANQSSIEMHQKLGFVEANRNVHFVRRLRENPLNV